MSQFDEKLASVAEQLKRGVAPQKESVRSMLLWFGFGRRGGRVNRRVRGALRRHGLVTVPEFEWAYLDSPISFQKAPPEGDAELTYSEDPTYRIGHLSSANCTLVTVVPDAPIQQIITLMMSNDFSQLPVMTSPRELKGAVSWKTIGTRLALNRKCATARDCMEEARVLRMDEPLFSAMSNIAAHDYVLIQAPDKTICGIVTASDLNDQFLKLAEPFLLVGEIENGIRRLLHGKFTAHDLVGARAPHDEGRDVESPADLTIGGYIRLLEQEAGWAKLKLPIDRVTFIRQLDRVREIRNDVMHFDPDGLDEDLIKFLREFALFLKRLRDVGAA